MEQKLKFSSKNNPLNDLGTFPVGSSSEAKILDYQKNFEYITEKYTKFKLLPIPNLSGVNIKEMPPTENARYDRIWNSFGKPLYKLAIDESIIAEILFSTDVKYKKIRGIIAFEKNFWANFLVKTVTGLLVISIFLGDDGLPVLYTSELSEGEKWISHYPNRFIAAE